MGDWLITPPTAKGNNLDRRDTIVKLGVPAKLVVRGHSDPRPMAMQLGGAVIDNQRLSELRASAVATVLKNFIKDPNLSIEYEGAGSRELKVKCQTGESSTKYEQEQCNSPNRRVEVRITYDHQKSRSETPKT